jgi:hypothetical protein
MAIAILLFLGNSNKKSLNTPFHGFKLPQLVMSLFFGRVHKEFASLEAGKPKKGGDQFVI